MSDQWYYVRSGTQVGPVSASDFRELVERGELVDSDAVWTRGLPGWTRLGEVREGIAPRKTQDPLAALGIAAVDLGFDRPRPATGKFVPRSYPMDPKDRIARALFVAVAVGLAWGIRGDFGHMLGAMYPGAILLMALAYVSGQESIIRSMPVLAAASAFGIGYGGNMSYGILHGYAQADTFNNYAYGFLALFLQGGSWGLYGGALVGLILERDRAKWTDWAGGVAVMAVSSFLTWWLVYELIGFDINPPRSNSALGHLGGAIGLFAWFLYRKLPIASRASLLGFVGFGLGMAGGRLIGNLFHNLEGRFEINHWNTMEVSCGLIGGFVVAYGMLGMRFRDRATDRPLAVWDVCGAVFVLGIIPLMHLLTRVKDEKVAEWTANLANSGSSWTAGGVSGTLQAVVLLGFIGAGLWIYGQAAEKDRWVALPVLWLSFVMLLFQNFRALYFFTPAKESYINMHGVFWLLFLAMAAYVAYREYQEGHTDECDSDEESDHVPWKPWGAIALAGFVIVVLGAGLVNGPTTMKNACTRWPIWEWNQGPFPGAPSK